MHVTLILKVQNSLSFVTSRAGTTGREFVEALGHSTIGITMNTYTHVLPNMQKEAADQFEQLLKKGM